MSIEYRITSPFTRKLDLNGFDIGGQTPLAWAAIKGSYEAAAILVKYSAKLNYRDNGGRTALIHATHGNNLKIVELLSESGADVNVKDSEDLAV